MSETHSFDIRGVSVAIGMPNYGIIQARTTAALAMTAYECARCGVVLDLIMAQGVLPWSRDNVVDEFLPLKSQKLFWIDADMEWTPTDFFRLLALSTVRDVVGAAYPAKVDGPVTFYAAYDGNQASQEYGLLPVNGMGLGFTVMDRAVVEKVVATKPVLHDQLANRDVHEVFRFGSTDGQRQGEDMAFFDDIKAAGYTVWMDPSIELGHVGTKVWRGRIADAFTKTDTEYVGGKEKTANGRDNGTQARPRPSAKDYNVNPADLAFGW